MVKGVTRRIIEVKETGSNNFERAIFFVRQDIAQNEPEYTLAQEATRIIERFCSDLKFAIPTRKDRILTALKYVLSAAAGAVLTILLLELGALI